MKPKAGMSSTEAAALYLSDGQTDDPGLASMLDYAKHQPQLLIPKGFVGMTDYEPAKLIIDNPDATERQGLRNKVGFDYTVTLGPKQATVTNVVSKRITICNLTDDDDLNASNLARAVIRLKAIHDKATSVPEAELA